MAYISFPCSRVKICVDKMPVKPSIHHRPRSLLPHATVACTSTYTPQDALEPQQQFPEKLGFGDAMEEEEGEAPSPPPPPPPPPPPEPENPMPDDLPENHPKESQPREVPPEIQPIPERPEEPIPSPPEAPFPVVPDEIVPPQQPPTEFEVPHPQEWTPPTQ